MTETLDKLVKRARGDLAMTQEELARATNTTVSRISRIERGSELFGFPKSARLAKALKLDHSRVVAAILRSLVLRAGLKYDVSLKKGAAKRGPRVGEEVARLRYARGVSVRQLASKSGMLPSRIAKVENDPMLVLQPHTAVRFAEALGASKVDLAQLALQDLLYRHRLGALRVRLR